MATPTKVDLSSNLQDADSTVKSALQYISNAQRDQKAAADKAAQIMAPASLASSEASSAKAIFVHVDEQQDDLVAAGLDPVKVFGKLLNYAGTLAQSAKSRLVSAQQAAG